MSFGVRSLRSIPHAPNLRRRTALRLASAARGTWHSEPGGRPDRESGRSEWAPLPPIFFHSHRGRDATTSSSVLATHASGSLAGHSHLTHFPSSRAKPRDLFMPAAINEQVPPLRLAKGACECDSGRDDGGLCSYANALDSLARPVSPRPVGMCRIPTIGRGDQAAVEGPLAPGALVACHQKNRPAPRIEGACCPPDTVACIEAQLLDVGVSTSRPFQRRERDGFERPPRSAPMDDLWVFGRLGNDIILLAFKASFADLKIRAGPSSSNHCFTEAVSNHGQRSTGLFAFHGQGRGTDRALGCGSGEPLLSWP